VPRIKLIVTGDMEKAALHRSLQRMFPSDRDGQEVHWDVPRKLDSATSLPLLAGAAPSENMTNLARAMIAEAGIGKTGAPADLVVVIDDVELGNVGRVNVVLDHFRSAVTKVLDAYETATRARYRAILQQRCSFHLLHPMVEAYLFGDPGALLRAGVPAGQAPLLVDPDVERFETHDPVWLPTCQMENGRRQRIRPGWRHELHPKHYLEHLAERGGVFYEETVHGEKSLSGLAWASVPCSPAATPIVRALFEDISDWFYVANPLTGTPDPALYPVRTVNRAGLLLRNL
jgi:hypothetical protein